MLVCHGNSEMPSVHSAETRPSLLAGPRKEASALAMAVTRGDARTRRGGLTYGRPHIETKRQHRPSAQRSVAQADHSPHLACGDETRRPSYLRQKKTRSCYPPRIQGIHPPPHPHSLLSLISRITIHTPMVTVVTSKEAKFSTNHFSHTTAHR